MPGTCFQSDTTSVTFRFKDSADDIGPACANVTVRPFGDLNLNSPSIRRISPEHRDHRWRDSEVTAPPYHMIPELTLGGPVLDQILGDGAGSSVREIGRSAGNEDIKGIFQVVAFLASPEKAVRRSPSYWSRYCDTGTFVEEEIRTGYFRTVHRGGKR